MKALIGKKAPEFHAPAVVNGNEIIEDFSLEQYVGKKYVVMFFYPMDFTFVCPTELHAFQQKLQEFERRNVAVVGCSVDSQFSHFAWLNQDKNKGLYYERKWRTYLQRKSGRLPGSVPD